LLKEQDRVIHLLLANESQDSPNQYLEEYSLRSDTYLVANLTSDSENSC
jgi:hypothetical protein